MKYRMIDAKNIKGFKIDETSSSMVWMKALAQKLPEFVFRKMKGIPGIATMFLVPFSSANTITDEVDSWSDLLWLFISYFRALAFTCTPICQVTTVYGSFSRPISVIQ